MIDKICHDLSLDFDWIDLNLMATLPLDDPLLPRQCLYFFLKEEHLDKMWEHGILSSNPIVLASYQIAPFTAWMLAKSNEALKALTKSEVVCGNCGYKSGGRFSDSIFLDFGLKRGSDWIELDGVMTCCPICMYENKIKRLEEQIVKIAPLIRKMEFLGYIGVPIDVSIFKKFIRKCKRLESRIFRT